MTEYRPALVEQIIRAELNAALDYPAERPVMMKRSVVQDERVVRRKGLFPTVQIGFQERRSRHGWQQGGLWDKKGDGCRNSLTRDPEL